MNDIDLTAATAEGGELDTGWGWTPIEEFSGILDGNGYRIVGLTINFPQKEEKVSFLALIGALSGTVKRLGMVNVSIKCHSGDYAAGIAGYCEEEAEIEECYVTSNIQSGAVGGGIAASISASCAQIKNCINLANVNSEIDQMVYSWVAGITAHSSVFEDAISNCYNRGKITIEGRRKNEENDFEYEYEISENNKDCYYLRQHRTNATIRIIQ